MRYCFAINNKFISYSRTKNAKQNYNPARALFRNGLIANEVDILPQNILNEIAKYTLPRGHRAIAEAQAHAKAPYGNLSTQY